jgi:hypothetical protein
LAENALHIAKLRRSLQSQVRGAKQFIMNLVRQYGTGNEQGKIAEINAFADVDQQLQSLDQIVRDLLQLVSHLTRFSITANKSGICLGFNQ